MDVSKLPKLSQTPSPPQDEAPEPEERPEPAAPPASMAAEAWISIAVGALFLLLCPHTMQYASSLLFHTQFAPFFDPMTNAPADYVRMTDGSCVPYRQRIEFWSDLAVTCFSIAMLLDGLVLIFSRRRAVVVCGLAAAVLATLMNAVYVAATFLTYGLAFYSAVAVAIGGYIAISQWNMLQSMRPRGHPASP